MLAQGGICVLPEAADYQAFFDDTLRAGHGENRRESVDIMIRSSRSVINDLVALGVNFEREPDGSLAFTREGAHSRPRICYQADITGREITTKLLAQVRRLPNVEIWEHAALIDLLDEADPATGGRRCAGGLVRRVSEAESTATVEELRAGSGCALGETVLAGALVSSPAASSASAAAPDASPSPAAAVPGARPGPRRSFGLNARSGPSSRRPRLRAPRCRPRQGDHPRLRRHRRALRALHQLPAAHGRRVLSRKRAWP